jgi:hypothetical protein
MLISSVIMMSAFYAECCYAQCHYAECRGAFKTGSWRGCLDSSLKVGLKGHVENTIQVLESDIDRKGLGVHCDKHFLFVKNL